MQVINQDLVQVPAGYKPLNPALRLKSTDDHAYFQHCMMGTLLFWLGSTVVVYVARFIPDWDTGK